LNEAALALLKGSFDLHVHTSPSHFARRQDDFELLHTLDDFGMGGAVIKSHYGCTQARAEIANRYAGARAKLFGAITLDQTVGGINPYAVQAELYLGAKMVWLPTFHAKNQIEKTNNKPQPVMAPPIPILDAAGRLLPEVQAVIDLVVQYDAVLNTGHISAEESWAVCTEAVRRGAKVCLTHPDNSREAVDVEMQTALARQGVLIDRSWFNALRPAGGVSAAVMAWRIRATGAEHCIMTTDFGQKSNDPAPCGMLCFVEAMLAEGISEQEIRTMICDNPRALLGI